MGMRAIGSNNKQSQIESRHVLLLNVQPYEDRLPPTNPRKPPIQVTGYNSYTIRSVKTRFSQKKLK